MKNTPSYNAYAVRNTGKVDKDGNPVSVWRIVGAAWEINNGLRVQLDAFPVSGVLIIQRSLRAEKPSDDSNESAKSSKQRKK